MFFGRGERIPDQTLSHIGSTRYFVELEQMYHTNVSDLFHIVKRYLFLNLLSVPTKNSACHTHPHLYLPDTE